MRTSADSADLHDLLARTAWARRLARHLVPQTTEADDLLQEAWLVSAGRPRPAHVPAQQWLSGVLRVLGLRRARAAGRRRQRERESVAVQALAASQTAGNTTPDVLLEQVETQRRLAKSLLGLPEPYRMTVLLRYYEGLSAAEIARRTAAPEGTVRWRLKEGLDRLRAQLDEESGDRRAWALALLHFAGTGPARRKGPWIAVALGAAAVGVALGFFTSTGRWQGTGPVATEPAAVSAGTQPVPEEELEMKKKIGALAVAASLAAQVNLGAAPASATPGPIPASPVPRFLVPLGVGPVKGAATAKVTIVGFMDYECPFCARGSETMNQLVARHAEEVRYQVVQRPQSFHKNAAQATRAALAAHQQGKFWEMHEVLLANQKALASKDIEGYARAIGLDVARFRNDLLGATVINQADLEEANAASINVEGTPTFFFNGRSLQGARSLEQYEKVLKEEIAYAQQVLQAGVKPADLYNTIIKEGVIELPKTVPIAKGGERVLEARRKCVGSKEKLASGLSGIVITPVVGTLSGGKKLSKPQEKILYCLMDELKGMVGSWKL
jgi:RNA polymerase sigma factor (sigma-70 family)